MRFYLTAFLAIFISIGLSACGETEDHSSEDQEEDEEMKTETVSPGQFTDLFLEGEFERLYNQTSTDFQAIVTLEDFVDLGKGFNEGVGSYELASEIPMQNVVEYQWISDQGDKAIRSYFADDLTIEGLQLMPVTAFPE